MAPIGRTENANLMMFAGAVSEMKIAISMVKNEQDIIEPFIRHNIRFFDVFVVINNNSVDDTLKILTNLEAEFGNLFVVQDDDFDYRQGAKMTEIYHACQSCLLADFIMFLDADEFIGRLSPTEFDDLIATIPEGGVGYIPWRNFVLKPGDVASQAADVPRTMTWRRKEELSMVWKVIVRLDGTYRPDLIVSPGNHSIESASNETVGEKYFPDQALFHFPVRSGDQLASKSVVGWMAMIANKRTQDEMNHGGTQWGDNFTRACQGAMGNDELCARSMTYAQPRSIDWEDDIVEEAHGITYSRQYSDGSSLPPLAVIARSWHQTLQPECYPSHNCSFAGLKDRLEKSAIRKRNE